MLSPIHHSHPIVKNTREAEREKAGLSLRESMISSVNEIMGVAVQPWFKSQLFISSVTLGNLSLEP